MVVGTENHYPFLPFPSCFVIAEKSRQSDIQIANVNPVNQISYIFQSPYGALDGQKTRTA
jgi:hypothetical protein